MSRELDNLLGALRLQPDDHLTYQALADWCAEQPDDATRARGEYVRLSLLLGGLQPGDPAARELRRRVREVETAWRATWLGPLREMAHRCDFAPGGTVKVEVTHGRAFRARRAAAPKQGQFAWVSSLEVRSATVGDLRWLARRLPEGRVHSFRVQVTAGDGLGEALSRCRWLRGLRLLSVCAHPARMGEAEVIRIAGLRRLSGLGEFALFNADLGPPSCSALADSPALRHLRALTLHTCGLEAPALQVLAAGPSVPPLTSLSLEADRLSRRAAEVLADWPALASVRTLTLDRNPLGDDGLAALARSPHLGSLRELRVRQCGMTSRGLTELARATLGRLEVLDVRYNDGVADAGLLSVCRSAGLSALRELLHSRLGLRRRTVDELNVRFGTAARPHPG